MVWIGMVEIGFAMCNRMYNAFVVAAKGVPKRFWMGRNTLITLVVAVKCVD